MTLLPILVAAALELGLTFPAGGFEQEVNIGKYLKVSQKLVRFEWGYLSPYVRFSRYPGITSALSVYHGSAGIIVGSTWNLLRVSGGLGFGVGMLNSGTNIVNGEVCPSIRRKLSSGIPLYFSLSFPVMFFENTTLYSVNTGILFLL